MDLGLGLREELEDSKSFGISKIVFMGIKLEVLQIIEKESAKWFFSFFQPAGREKFIAAVKEGLAKLEPGKPGEDCLLVSASKKPDKDKDELDASGITCKRSGNS
jgi:hypothetical protein